jgi:hypothetical protein
MDSRQKSYVTRSFCRSSIVYYTWWIAAVLFEKQEKGFKRAKLMRRWRIRLTRGGEPKPYHADPSEDSERGLFDGR